MTVSLAIRQGLRAIQIDRAHLVGDVEQATFASVLQRTRPLVLVGCIFVLLGRHPAGTMHATETNTSSFLHWIRRVAVVPSQQRPREGPLRVHKDAQHAPTINIITTVAMTRHI